MADMFVDYTKLQADPAAVTGALTRAQWDDYVSRFQPIEKNLMDMSIYNTLDGGKAMIDKEINDAIGTGGYVQNAIASNKGQVARGMARYGMTATAEQQAGTEAKSGMNASLATVDAANRIRQNVLDRSNAIAVGSTPNAGRAIGLRNE